MEERENMMVGLGILNLGSSGTAGDSSQSPGMNERVQHGNFRRWTELTE